MIKEDRDLLGVSDQYLLVILGVVVSSPHVHRMLSIRQSNVARVYYNGHRLNRRVYTEDRRCNLHAVGAND